MAKRLSNPVKMLIRMKIGKLAYTLLLALAKSVHSKMTGNAAFATPSPSLATLATATTALESALIGVGTKRNKGSKASVLSARDSATHLRGLLTALVGYVESTLSPTADVPLYNATLASAGFSLKSIRSRVPKMKQVTFIQHNNSAKFIPTDGRIQWRRPLTLLKGLPVDGFNIYKAGVLISTTTAGFFYTNQPLKTESTYTVRPFNARGEGQSMNVTVRT